MFQLTSRGNYGVLAMYYIAKQPRGIFVSIDAISEQSKVPKPYLSKILQSLCRANILHSRRGTGGGFLLARAPKEITLKEVIEVIEGKMYLVSCLFEPSQCGKPEPCPISPLWGEVQKFLHELIQSITFEDIVDEQKKEFLIHHLAACRGMYAKKIQMMRDA